MIPVSTHADIPADTPVDAPADTRAHTPLDTPTDMPAELTHQLTHLLTHLLKHLLTHVQLLPTPVLTTADPIAAAAAIFDPATNALAITVNAPADRTCIFMHLFRTTQV